MTNDTMIEGCVWLCGDSTPGHKHWALSIRENGKLLGRLTPEGTTTNRNMFAWIMSRATAEKVAEEINNTGEFIAKIVKF